MWQHQRLFNWFVGFEAQRKRALAQAPQGPLKEYLSIAAPSLNAKLTQLPIIAVDFETTGLNPLTDKILSVGSCTLKGHQIQLAHSYHQIINTKTKLAADNVVIHQITDQQQQAGESLEQVLADLLQAIAGKVMLVHYHQIEQRFLQQACKQLYGIAPPLLMIDTLLLAKRRLDRRDIAYDPSSLRLANLRRHFQLPDYYAHNALSDAIATAEVYLAETNHYADKVSLREVLV